MQNLLDKRAVVVGAGIGGLAAAKALSMLFAEVTVIDRDVLPTEPAPRIGTPQARLVHILLAGGLKALRNSFPGIEKDLLDAGAVQARVGSEIRLEIAGYDPFPKRPFEFYSTCLSRPLFEWVLRKAVQEQENITIHARRRADRLILSEHGRVIGVEYEDADGTKGRLPSDLVVDASLRGALTLEALDSLSLPRPFETEIGVDVGYATSLYEKPADADYDWKLLIQRPSVDNSRAGFITPIEKNLWHVNLAGINGDHPPEERDAYLAFARSLRMPTLYNAIKDARPIGDIHRFILRNSVRRRFEDLSEFPDGVIPLGDAICRINPSYGQGMSVAAQEAEALRTLIVERSSSQDPLAGLSKAFFRAVCTILEGPWSIGEADFVYPRTRGDRTPAVERNLKNSAAVLRRAAQDPAAHRAWAEVTNLLAPTSALNRYYDA